MNRIDDFLQAWHNKINNHHHLNNEIRLELESHLMDEMEQLSGLPLSHEERFLIASHRLGSPESLNDEFGKVAKKNPSINFSPGLAQAGKQLKSSEFSRRFMAHVFDICILCFSWILILLSLGSRSVIWLGATFLFLQIFSFLYFVIPTFLWGATPGKMMTDIKVTDLQGNSISFVQSVLRSLPHLLFAILAIALTIEPLHFEQSNSIISSINSLSLDAININTGYLFHPALVLLSMAWAAFSIIVLKINFMKRAPNDFLAETMVVINEDGYESSESNSTLCYQF